MELWNSSVEPEGIEIRFKYSSNAIKRKVLELKEDIVSTQMKISGSQSKHLEVWNGKCSHLQEDLLYTWMMENASTPPHTCINPSLARDLPSEGKGKLVFEGRDEIFHFYSGIATLGTNFTIIQGKVIKRWHEKNGMVV